MKRIAVGWMMAGMLVGLLAGCSDDDDGPASAEAVAVADVVDGSTGGQANGAENPGVAGDTEEQSANSPDAEERGAPQLVSPDDDAEYFVLLFNGKAKVTFRWTALPGVAEYDLRMGHIAGGYRFSGTTGTLEFPVGTYSWWIEGMYPVSEQSVEAGPASAKRTFTVRQQNIGILPLQ